MATLSREFIAQDQSQPDQGPKETLHRLSLYFQTLGVPEDRAAEVAEEIVREAQDRSGGPGETLTSAAVDRALEAVGHWLDEIAAGWQRQAEPAELADGARFAPRSIGPGAPGSPAAATCRRLQLAWFLRPVLMRHPEAFLRSENLPEDFHQAIRAAGKPILLPPSPTVMPAQPLGELPRLWYRLLGYGNLLWERFVEALEQSRMEL